MADRKSTKHIVLHCSATRANQPIDAKTIKGWHTTPVAKGGRGWSDIGYHYVIKRDGKLEAGRRPDTSVGSHVAGYNSSTLGICLVGGLSNATGKPENNFTPEQWATLKGLVIELSGRFKKATILGHRDLSPDKDGDGVVEPHEWLKMCPCFDAKDWARKNGLPAAP